MTTATERNLDGEVNKALAALRRRRAFKELAVIVAVIAVIGSLLGLAAIMYQEPLDAEQRGKLPPNQP
jgi:hypothetical protein